MEATVSESVTNNEKVTSDEAENQELQKLVTSVVQKRKTIPTKCMKIYKEIIRYDIKRLQSVEVKLKEDKNHQKFMKLLRKLGSYKTPKISFDELNEAERRLLKCQQKLKDINNYLKKRKQCNQ